MGDPRGRIGTIDGLRALAICGVIGYHIGLGPAGGYLGVDLFFVISGFVITRSLLHERDALGTISLSGFWLRRVKRIFPAVALVLIAVGLWARLGATASFTIAASQQSLAALVSGVNWWQIFGPTGYWDLGAQQSPLTHLWSLAVEEQFYLVWPVAFAAIFIVPRSKRWIVLATLAAISYAWAAFLADPNAIANDHGILNRIYEGTDTRASALFLGAAAALAPPMERRNLTALQRRAAAAAVWAAVLLLAVTWATVEIMNPALYWGILAVTGVSAATLVYSAGSGMLGLAAPILGSTPSRWIGKLSYSLYLWHWPVWVWLETSALAGQGLPEIAAALGLSTILAFLTYTLVEKPIMRSKLGWKYVIPAMIAITAMVAVNASTLLETTHLQTTENTGVTVTK